MKIYLLEIEKRFQPSKQAFNYPVHNRDYGIEQDFLVYIQNNNLLTNNPEEADWHYLPVFWTHWHLDHDYGKTGLEELRSGINSAILDEKKTFTVCQYDDGPVIETGKIKVFLGSRKTINGYDAPLLSSNHKLPLFKPTKKYLGSFVGRTSTHSIREDLHASLKNDSRFLFVDGSLGEKFFVKVMLQSLVALCPRGYGGSSFRFYEAMQIGVVPFQIGDIDTRPFKKSIKWDEFSFYTNDAAKVRDIILSKSKTELLEMGKKAKAFYKSDICYQKWCSHLIKELEL